MDDHFKPPNPRLASGGTYVPPEDKFEVLTQEPLVRFVTKAVQPPSSIYIAPTDVLQVGAASSQAGESLTVTYRILRADGVLVYSQFKMNVTGNRVINIHRENLCEGFLLSVSCKATAATTRGQTFVRMFLSSPSLGSGQPSYMLMADYVTTAMAPAHPNGRQLAPTEGPGSLVVLDVTPALFSEISVTIPTNARWRFMSLLGEFNANGTPGNRFPVLQLLINGTNAAQIPFPDPGIPQNQFALITWAPDFDSLRDANGNILLPFGNQAILGGPLPIIIRTQTVGFSFGNDSWGVGTLNVEEWLDNV